MTPYAKQSFTDFGFDVGKQFIGLAGDIGLGFLNNYFARQASAEQYQRQVQFWNIQNSYNHPVAQRSRLEQAGLNPNLMYGQGGIQNTSAPAPQVPGNQYAQSGMVKMQMMQQAMQLGLMNADLRLKQAEAKNVEADTSNKNAQTGLYGAQTKTESTVQALNDSISQFNYATHELRKLGIHLGNEKLRAEFNNLNAYTLLHDENRKDLQETRKYRINALRYQTYEAAGKIALMRKQGKLTDEEYKQAVELVKQANVATLRMQRLNYFEQYHGPVEFYNSRGLFGSGISIQSLTGNFNNTWNNGIKPFFRSFYKAITGK